MPKISPAIVLLMASAAAAQWNDSALRPFTMNHRHAGSSAVDLSFLLDAPAGKSGFVRVQGGHFVKGDGSRIRFWGVHLTDWSPGSVLLPPKEDIPMWANSLARFGVNCVRLHFLDLPAPRGIIDGTKDDSRSFDPQQLDRLDFMVSELKSRGIYVDLNLNVGRSYKAGDGVRDYDKIRWGKGVILYDPRLIELQKEYARQLLTHRNPYTGSEYRNEPAVAIVEIDNENGIGVGFRAPTAYYQDELTNDYNDWLRHSAGAAVGAPVPLLKGSEVAAAPEDRFRNEVSFYMSIEDSYYREMNRYLKTDIGVKVPVIGTADHSHTSSGFPMLTSLLQMDALDGHIYWEHPESPPPVNTPMVNDPLHSTVVQLSRTAFAGKPYTVTETNHPFPNEWASEGIPIIAAYGSFQDWDAILTYTFEPKRAADWQPYVGDPFDISHDPVRMTEFAAGAVIFERADVSHARDFVERTYSREQVIDSRRLPSSEIPYFTPGFPLAIPLEHGVRIRDGESHCSRLTRSDRFRYRSTLVVRLDCETRHRRHRYRPHAGVGWLREDREATEESRCRDRQRIRQCDAHFARFQRALGSDEDAAHRGLASGEYRDEMEFRAHQSRQSGGLAVAHRAGHREDRAAEFAGREERQHHCFGWLGLSAGSEDSGPARGR